MALEYRIGIDVGLNSVGFAAIKVDAAGSPEELLSCMSLVHDAGVDPSKRKQRETRLASSGLARRVRRLNRSRKKRLRHLDSLLQSLGWPVPLSDPSTSPVDPSDPSAPWKIRAELADFLIDDDAERLEKLSAAVRHIARHRGWRNPYETVRILHEVRPDSEKMTGFRERVDEAIGMRLPSTLTVGQLVEQILELNPYHPLRRKVSDKKKAENKQANDEGRPSPWLEPLIGVIEQSDYANELHRIFEVQEVPEEIGRRIIDSVFFQKSPKGSWAGRVGKDPLNGKPRAPKAHRAFQRYRMATLLANLRIDGRQLTVTERNQVFDFLWNHDLRSDPSWDDVCDELGISRGQLQGTAQLTEDGERASARPPVNNTDRLIREKAPKAVKDFWSAASDLEQDALVLVISNESDPEESAVDTFLSGLSAADLQSLDDTKLPAGRASYSAETLDRIADIVLSSEKGLFDARLDLLKERAASERGVLVADLPASVVDELRDWRPPADPIGEPVGNPAVDRVTKAVNRWILAAEKEWGLPQSVTIEHVRAGLGSAKLAHELDVENQNRFKQHRKVFEEIAARTGVRTTSRNDLRRYQAIVRQNCQCLYCGGTISFRNAEMDHIVPRAGAGSNNRRENLVAVCHRCNLAKGKRLFSEWAVSSGIPEVSLTDAIERVKHWLDDGSVGNKKAWREYTQAVIARLKRKDEDPEFDGRSLESVAWMATALRHRIAAHYDVIDPDSDDGVHVDVYRGALTAEARKASGIESRLALIAGGGKTRLDRRHHAVDACVIALLNRSVAVTLAERIAIRDEEGKEARRDDNGNWVKPTWKTHEGSTTAAQGKYKQWLEDMNKLLELINAGLEADTIPVVRQLRLRLANSSAHKDTIEPLAKRRVGDHLPAKLIDRASTPALWCALTSHPDFDATEGLPEDRSRRIRLHDRWLEADDRIGFFAKSAASIQVRGGSVEVGDSVHHARVYRYYQTDGSGKRTVLYGWMRVFAADLKEYLRLHQLEEKQHRKMLPTGLKRSPIQKADRGIDLFSVELPPQSLSRRYCEGKLRQALAEGTAEYLGWLTLGDELELDMSKQTKDKIAEFLNAELTRVRVSIDDATGEIQDVGEPQVIGKPFAETTRWVLDGFESETSTRLRPVVLSSEGIARFPYVDSLEAERGIQENEKWEVKLESGAVQTIIDSRGWRPSINPLFTECNPKIIRRDTLGRVRTVAGSHLPVCWSVASME
ncbi:MAG: HNH endonuclease [Propionibacteriaceae bacterium]|jgi:CRISPR-associated endonuclease Csn1|nr:HNH endonuclease [Propionibacteriaceae bacterium]